MKLLIRVIVSVVIAAAGMAQMPPPKGVRTIDFYRVKRDRIEDFQAAVKDYNVALKKAGGPIGYTMFVALSGPAEYIRIIDHPNWAEMDSGAFSTSKYPGQAAEITLADRRIRDANDGARRVVVELYPDFSSPGNGMPKMMILQWTKLVPGRGGEFLAILDSDLMPAMRKLARYHLLARVALGEAQYQLLRFTGMENYATLDADSFAKTMGAENQAYRARLERLTLEVREDVYRYLPELSYQPVGSSK